MGSISLTQLADSLGTDKGTHHKSPHGYTLLYDMLFRSRRDEEISILELGLQTPSDQSRNHVAERKGSAIPSVQMWLSYFPKATILGVDISDFQHFKCPGFEFLRVDLSDENDINKIVNTGHQFDLIIDDASHSTHDQIQCFRGLYQCLSSKGIYIVEDLHWQPPASEQENARTFLETMKYFSLYGIFPEDIVENHEDFDYHTSNIGSVLFHSPDNNGYSPEKLCVIHKTSSAAASYFRMKTNNDQKSSDIRIDAANKLLSLFPNDILIKFEVAKAYDHVGEISRSLGVLNGTPIEFLPPEAAVFHSALMIKSQKKSQVLANLNQYLAALDSDEASHIQFIELLINEGLIDRCPHIVESFLNVHQEKAQCHFKIGKAFSASALKGEGTVHLEKAVQQQPGTKRFHTGLIENLGLTRDTKKLNKRIDEALSIFPEDPQILPVAAWACIRSDNIQTLQKLFEQHHSVLNTRPGIVEALHRLRNENAV